MRAPTVPCLCGREVSLASRAEAQKEGPGGMRPFHLFGGVCICGRGVDLSVEAEPASVPSAPLWCEWNPAQWRLRLPEEAPHAKATVLVGAGVSTHLLCASCVALPLFRRKRTKRQLSGGGAP